MNRPQVSDLFVSPASSIREVIACIDRSARISIALVVDGERHLLATITDGDIRRAILAGITLDAPISELMPIKAKLPNAQPITAPSGTEPAVLLQQMLRHSVRQLPLLDAEGRVVDIAILSDLLPQAPQPPHAVIMAGGLGTRLRPLTEQLPKPMVQIGDRPLLERIIEQLRKANIGHIHVSTHYQSEKIVEYFGDGQEFGVQLDYINEDSPLGTAGALGLMPAGQEPLLVINGDILTEVNYQAMLSFHQEHRAEMTVAVRAYGLQVPYGVVECDGPRVRRLAEKPRLSFFVNAGIYLLEPTVRGFIPGGQRFDMTDLIQRLLDAGRHVVSFPIVEYWLDVGQRADYEQALEDVRNGRLAR